MEITFLGTGTSQGIPIIACKCDVCKSTDPRDNRLRSSILIKQNDCSILVDSGPDFRYQMLREQVDNLSAILFTHEHRDHIAGLDDIRAFNFIHKKPVDVYAEERVEKAIGREFSYVFADDKYPGVPDLNVHQITGMEFYIDEIKIIPIRAYHYKLPVYGFRVGDFSYLTDANSILEEEKKKLIGSKHLVVGAVRKEKHISHYSLSEAIDLINEIKPEMGYITHIGHQMGTTSENENELPKNVQFAYDGLKIDI